MINHQTATATGTASSSSNLQENNIRGHHHHHHQDHEEPPAIRDIHPLTPPHPPRREAWPETSSHRSSSLSIASNISENEENFTSMSREFNALVLAGSNIDTENNDRRGSNNLGRIGEEDNFHEETNPLAIVPDNSPLDGAAAAGGGGGELDVLSNSIINTGGSDYNQMNISVQSVKKEEVESKINAWVDAKIAKINNRFKRDDAIINGWEGEQVQKATLRMNKVERKLEAKRAKAMEKMQNDIAKAHRKAEERRASAEAKRGTKVAGVLEVANLMKAVGRAPAKRSFF